MRYRLKPPPSLPAVPSASRGTFLSFFFGLVWLVGNRDKRGDVLLWQNFMIYFHRRRLEAGVVCPISDLRRHDASALRLSPNPDDFTNQPDDSRLGFHDSGPSLVDTSRQHPAGPRLTPPPSPTHFPSRNPLSVSPGSLARYRCSRPCHSPALVVRSALPVPFPAHIPYVGMHLNVRIYTRRLVDTY